MNQPVNKLSREKQLLLERRLRGTAAGEPDRVIPRRPDPDHAPLSFSQEQMWVIDQMAPGNPAYNLPVAYRLGGDLDCNVLGQCFGEIIQRHEVLRTTFAMVDGEARQIIHRDGRPFVERTDLSSLRVEERETALQDVATRESLRSFDLSRLPLMRVHLVKLARDDHVLILNLHHIVADGLSIRLIASELDSIYRARTSGGCPDLPDLPVQYADYAHWQRRHERESSFSDQLAFWKDQLGRALPVLEMPLDKPRPPLQSFNGGNVFFVLPRSLVRDLRGLGERAGCSFFTTILAAFHVILYRYSGAKDLPIGTPISNRVTAEAESLVGNFLNMAALRCGLTEDLTFSELLEKHRELILNAFSNMDVPFEKVVEILRSVRDPGRNPVFQVMLQVLPAIDVKVGDLEVRDVHFDLGISQFDLSLHLYEEAEDHFGRFEYCTDLFQAETVQRFSSNFRHLLEEVVRDPDRRVSRIPILAKPERRRVLHEWNATSRDQPEYRCVHQLFEAAVEADPHRTAVEFCGQTLSYGELNARSNQLAHHLTTAGVKPETLIGVCLERSLELVVGLLGILKAGAAYVPLEPSCPPDRLAGMAEDAEITFLLTSSDLAASFPSRVRTMICMDSAGEDLRREPITSPVAAAAPSSLAYAIYTSGSTGKPKGVMIEHRSVANLLVAMQKQPGFTPRDVLVAVTTISFDIAVLEIFLPLVTGGKVVLARREDAADGHLLLRLMDRVGATVLQATPATWKLLCEAGWKETPDLKMLCGGEALSRDLAHQMLERGGELWNMYGPTETTVWSSVHRVVSGSGPVLIGPPMAGTRFYIVDRGMEPVPIGAAGELLIGGEGLARGYLNQPALTAERFVADPFDDSASRLYRTGDRARFRADGTIEYLGRLDSQVKVRGHRIESGEIEHVMSQHPNVREAVVMLRGNSDDDARLICYWIRSTDAQRTDGDFRGHLRRKLPDYMIPSIFIEMDAWPLTPNGKIDRNGFPAPDPDRDIERGEGHDPATGDAPRGDLERQLAALWKDALNRNSIGANDDFFESGGHSLLAARLFARLERTMGVKLPLAVMLQAPTIRSLARRIENGDWVSSWRSLVPVQALGQRRPLFLIHGAEGNVLLYHRLARELGDEQPLYGLQSRGLDGQEPPLATVEDMAETYLREIKEMQPGGPYYLGGYCLGGTIAFEIARRLRQAGEDVALLVMIETYNLRTRPPVSRRLALVHKVQNVCFHLGNLWISIVNGAPGFFREKLLVEVSRMRSRWEMLRETLWEVSMRPGHRGQARRRPGHQRLMTRSVNDRAQKDYSPADYDGEILLIRPRRHYHGFEDEAFGWGAVAGRGVKTIRVDNFPRGSMNDPFAKHVASRIREEIEERIDSENKAARVV